MNACKEMRVNYMFALRTSSILFSFAKVNLYKFSDNGSDGYLNSIMCQIESVVKDSLGMTLWEMAKIVNNANY